MSTVLVWVMAAPGAPGKLSVSLEFPPQRRAITAPVAATLEDPLPETEERSAWILVDGNRRVAMQFLDVSRRRFAALLPLEKSEANKWTTFRFEKGSAPAAAFSLRREESERLYVLEGAHPVLAYNYGMILKEGVPEDRRRSSYAHPIFAPDGTVLTDDFPADHPHHRGLSWMWPNVFVDGVRHSLWDIRGMHQRFERWIETSVGPVFARVKVENGWYAGQRKVAREIVELTIYRTTREGRAIDVTLEFEAIDNPIKLVGELPDGKGYGGLCFRFGSRQDTILTTPAGIQPKDSDLQPFPWADLFGRFGTDGRYAGAAIFVNSLNPGFPNGWTLRHYGFLGVAWPGLEPHELQPGRPLVLHYRVWIHTGKAEVEELEAHYRAYANPPRARARSSPTRESIH